MRSSGYGKSASDGVLYKWAVPRLKMLEQGQSENLMSYIHIYGLKTVGNLFIRMCERSKVNILSVTICSFLSRYLGNTCTDVPTITRSQDNLESAHFISQHVAPLNWLVQCGAPAKVCGGSIDAVVLCMKQGNPGELVRLDRTSTPAQLKPPRHRLSCHSLRQTNWGNIIRLDMNREPTCHFLTC